MPFTFCHPAIILPLAKINRNRISATGLILGSMSPDFEYFIKMRMEKIHGHSFWGLFYFDLPLTLLLCFVFHLFVRDSLIQHLPQPIRRNYTIYHGLDWISWVKRRWFVLIYSSLIGIFSHIFWDAFTHSNGFFVRNIPLLQGSTVVFDLLIRKADLLQAMSSVFGAIVIVFILLWPRAAEFECSQFILKLKYWSGVALITLITLILRNGETLGDFIATSIAGTLLGLIITPFLLKLNFKRIT
jgi:hypothetical protein